MKILDALGKALQGLKSILWFVVVVATIACVFLLWYANNGSKPQNIGCPFCDALGICSLINTQPNKQWIGLIAIISIIMVAIGGALWVWQKLKPILFPPDGNSWLGLAAIIMIVTGVALWAWQMLVRILPPPVGNQWIKNQWIELIAVLLILIGGAVWAWQKLKQRPSVTT